jgi:Zn-dependent M28 family amino/carboxypeptidase
MFISNFFEKNGYKPQKHGVEHSFLKGFYNVEAKLGADHLPTLVLGAHYDSAQGSPGADDNASGVATVLELARILKPLENQFRHQILFTTYTLEEDRQLSGSRAQVARLLKENKKLKLMFNFEMVGYYSNEPNSQDFFFSVFRLFYPSRGNFLAFVSNPESRAATNQFTSLFKSLGELPLTKLSAPNAILGFTQGSDHWSFWEADLPAILVTDTGPLRNKNYHRPSDKTETLDLNKMEALINTFAKALLVFDQL